MSMASTYVHGVLPSGETVIAEQRAGASAFGDTVEVRFDPTAVRIFDASGQRLR